MKLLSVLELKMSLSGAACSARAIESIDHYYYSRQGNVRHRLSITGRVIEVNLSEALRLVSLTRELVASLQQHILRDRRRLLARINSIIGVSEHGALCDDQAEQSGADAACFGHRYSGDH